MKFCSPILLCLAASGELLDLQISFEVAFEATFPFHVPAAEWVVPNRRVLFVYRPSFLLAAMQLCVSLAALRAVAAGW